MQTNELTPSEAYGQWVANCPDDWSEAALESAHRQLIDTIAVMVPGAVEPAAQAALQSIAGWFPASAAGVALSSVAGYANAMPPPWAALINGTAAHALDFDDNFDPSKAHASAVLYPAILAITDAYDLSGAAALDAFIVGLQIMGRVGQGVNPVHRNRGWHATATVGVFGTAAACARLLKLDAIQAGHALSLATSLSSGFMSQFGTMAKPLHAGLAAQNGVIAATLASQGMEAGKHTMDGPTGMNTLMVGPDRETLKQNLSGAEHGQTLSFTTDGIGEPLMITEYGFRVKRFPNCGSAHRAMDGLLEIMDTYQLSAKEIEKVDVYAPMTHLNNLFYPRPKTGLEAKFSMPYALACLLEDRHCGLGDFMDERVNREIIQQHYQKIHTHPVDKLESVFPTRVEVKTYTGEQYEVSMQMPKGSIAAPFPTDVYWKKLAACIDGFMPTDQLQHLKEKLETFSTLNTTKEMTQLFMSA